MKYTLYNDDCLNALKKMKDNSIDSCVTDPPYGLSFMGNSWDYDVPKAEIWKEVLRVLKPGGHLLAFFGSRTYHRGVVQIEDAGFEVRDQIMWLYGSGFPKSHNIGKAIDKEAGAKRKVVGNSKNFGVSKKEDGKNSFGDYSGEWELTEPATDEAKQWEGWGTALKPAHEPIVVARKPITQTVAKNVLEYGTGALNIDACRTETKGMKWEKPRGGIWKTDSEADAKLVENELGRWPANVIYDGSDEVVNKLGEPSRFFYCAKASKADRDEGLDQVSAKKVVTFATENETSSKPSSLSAGRNTEYKNNHPTVKPTELMRYLCRLVTPKNGIVLDPFMGSGSTGKAAILESFNFIGIEREKGYYEIAETRIQHVANSKSQSLDDFFT